MQSGMTKKKKLNKKNKNICPGDLVTLRQKLNHSLVLWSSWDDYEESYLHTWPSIMGHLRNGELAIVLEVTSLKEGINGAKIYTQESITGWANIKCLIRR